ncbi:hypothetical protein [Streptomyces sp. NPDC008141]|uniref:hypothetical protein n=1 Tax=Streptomyces sp. NPDC008141 TaxID=3364815 RepID=UPI0036E33774
MVRTAAVRWAGWIVGVLVLGLLAAWVWWRESDTAARWRFEEAMATYCGGVLAYEKGPLFEGLWPGLELPNDVALGPEAQFCLVGEGRTAVTVALLRGDYRDQDLERILRGSDSTLIPVPLTGGWRGTANGEVVRVLLPCQGGTDLVSVTVGSYSSLNASDEEEARRKSESGWIGSDLYWARFATATAAKASAHWDCKAEAGKPLRALPAITGPEQTSEADGTCAGLPFARDHRLDTVQETVVGAGALTEMCEVGASEYFNARYEFSASFGPYAARQRNQGGQSNHDREAGVNKYGGVWASARCPGDAVRAHFTGFVPAEAATVWRPGEKGKETFGLPAFREFAERSAKRHGCTDLRLPAQ